MLLIHFYVDKDVEEAVTETLLTKDILKNGGSVENDDVTQLNGSNIDKYALLLVNYINLVWWGILDKSTHNEI